MNSVDDIIRDISLSDGSILIHLMFKSNVLTEFKPTISVLLDTNILNQITEKDMIKLFLDPNTDISKLVPSKQVILDLMKIRGTGKVSIYIADLTIIELFSKSVKHYRLWESLESVIIKIVPNSKYFQELWFIFSGLLTFMVQEKYLRKVDFKDFYIYCLASLSQVKYVISDDKSFKDFYNGFHKLLQKDFDKGPKNKRLIAILKKSSKFIRPDFYFTINITGLIHKLLNSPPIPMNSADFISKKKQLVPITLFDQNLNFWFNVYSDYKILIQDLIPNDFLQFPKASKYKNLVLSLFSSEFDLEEEELLKIKYFPTKEIINKIKTLKMPIKQEYVKIEEEFSQYVYESDMAILEERDRIYSDLESYNAKFNSEKKFKVRCEDCGLIQDIITYYQGKYMIDSRAMGAEYEHRWDNEIDCERCNNGIILEYFEWEYPVGSINDSDHEVSGGDVEEDK